jgi:hypothetical protein
VTTLRFSAGNAACPGLPIEHETFTGRRALGARLGY